MFVQGRRPFAIPALGATSFIGKLAHARRYGRRSRFDEEPAKELIEYGKALTYEFLLRECCAKLGIKDSHICSLEMLEVYLYELVIAKAVVAMRRR